MATSLKESFDRVYTEENLTPVVAGSAASEQAFGGQRHAEDCAAVAGITFAESPFEKSNFRGYYSERKRMNVQHFLQAAAVIIGTKRHRFRNNSNGEVSYFEA
jgi:hypothetical protein